MNLPIPVPTEIKLHQKSRFLEIAFEHGERFELSYEYLRVYSPSAEVRGHHPDEAILQVGKADVMIQAINPVGTYAVLLQFDDGHKTGIYSWEWLYYLGKNKEALWQAYLEQIEQTGQSRFSK